MADSFLYDVFLSHNQADKPKVRLLAERLRSAGVRVWFDEWVIKAGEIISLKVDEGLEQSRVLLLCISPEALASGWVALERSTAIHRDPFNAGRRFIPLLLAECDLPDTLAKYKYLDFREESDAIFAELLASCKPETDFLPTSSLPEVQKRSVAKKSSKQPTAKKPTQETSPEESEPLAEQERKLTGQRYWVRSVAVSPDGTWAASGAGITGDPSKDSSGDSKDNTIKIWDLESGECRQTFEGHTANVESVAIAPDGKQIFSGSRDRTIRRWQLGSPNEMVVLKGHSHYVMNFVVAADGKNLFSCSANEGPPTF